jgi:hypothetical protein
VITCHVRYEIDPDQIEAFEPAALRRRPGFVEADRIRDESGCIRRYERSFLRPLLP